MPIEVLPKKHISRKILTSYIIQGYYVHLSTYAEVREEVLHYIPVMARPMVLNPNQKPNPSWSPIYADVTDPKLTNWLWVTRARNRQRERYKGWEKLKADMKKESGQIDMRLVKNIKEVSAVMPSLTI